MALTLTRKVDEVVYIGNDITVRVASVQGHQVRLAISAPPQVKILREELLASEQRRYEDE